MRIDRRYNTKAGLSPYAGHRLPAHHERNPQSGRFRSSPRRRRRSAGAMGPQVASDVLAQKYFRKAGVPHAPKKVEEETVPSWLWRSIPDEEALKALPEAERFTGEVSSKQVFDRLAGTWTYWGWKGGYFSSESDAQAFFDEHRYIAGRCRWWRRIRRNGSTPACTGYGIDGPSQGHFYVDYRTGQLGAVRHRLRTSAAACLLHPVDRRRPRQRGRHHGPVGARGAPVQIRAFRHRLEFLEIAR